MPHSQICLFLLTTGYKVFFVIFFSFSIQNPTSILNEVLETSLPEHCKNEWKLTFELAVIQKLATDKHHNHNMHVERNWWTCNYEPIVKLLLFITSMLLLQSVVVIIVTTLAYIL